MRPGPSSEVRRWRQYAIATVALLLWIGYIYRDTAMSMASIWARSDTFAHGFLVAPIALWLIWRKRADLLSKTPSATALGLIVVLAFGLMWLSGDLAGANAVVQLAFVGMLVASVVAVLGWSVARAIAFPLGFLFFAVPIGEFLLPLFMKWTADFTVLALRLSGIPVYREGLQFVIPSGNWSVVEACSGIRYLIASLTIGTLFAYLNYRSWQRRALFIGFSILVPVVANWFRAYMIVMLGHLSDNRLATGVDHLVYGWVFFGFVILIMFMVGARWSEPGEGPDTARSPDDSARSQPAVSWLFLVAAAVVAALPHFLSSMSDTSEGPALRPVLVAPAALKNGWERVDSPLTDWEPIFEGASAGFHATYRKNDSLVGLHIAYYRNQSYDHKLVSSANRLALSESARWRKVADGRLEVECGAEPISVKTAELRNLQAQPQHAVPGLLSVWQFYWIDGTTTASDPLALLHSALGRLFAGVDDSASVIVYANQQDGAEPLGAFMRANCAFIGELLRQVREKR